MKLVMKTIFRPTGNTHGYFIFGSSLHIRMIVNSLFSGKAVSESQELMRLITGTEETKQWKENLQHSFG